MNFDMFQKAVAESYVGGEFNNDEVLDNMDDCGDGLFKFLMTELSEEEGCDSYDEAVRRLSTIQRQIEEVKRHMMAKEEVEA
ncbi:hypothetical protein KAR91_24500 [Candidatus Pacearchaeota archaeon]|nr:hypothetical protein [Candidatus Pacearchaeota archaeon]